MRLSSLGRIAAAAALAVSPMAINITNTMTSTERQAPRRNPQRQSSLPFPRLNRSRKWRPERSYSDAAETTFAMGLRSSPTPR